MSAQPEEEVPQLREASNYSLLKAYAQLTHVIHAAVRKQSYRDQRDKIELEILRRMQSGESGRRAAR